MHMPKQSNIRVRYSLWIHRIIDQNSNFCIFGPNAGNIPKNAEKVYPYAICYLYEMPKNHIRMRKFGIWTGLENYFLSAWGKESDYF